MPLKKREDGKGRKGAGMSGKTALLVGGAGLLLFILGVKRRYRLDDGREIAVPDDDAAGVKSQSPSEGTLGRPVQ